MIGKTESLPRGGREELTIGEIREKVQELREKKREMDEIDDKLKIEEIEEKIEDLEIQLKKEEEGPIALAKEIGRLKALIKAKQGELLKMTDMDPIDYARNVKNYRNKAAKALEELEKGTWDKIDKMKDEELKEEINEKFRELETFVFETFFEKEEGLIMERNKAFIEKYQKFNKLLKQLEAFLEQIPESEENKTVKTFIKEKVKNIKELFEEIRERRIERRIAIAENELAKLKRKRAKLEEPEGK